MIFNLKKALNFGHQLFVYANHLLFICVNLSGLLKLFCPQTSDSTTFSFFSWNDLFHAEVRVCLIENNFPHQSSKLSSIHKKKDEMYLLLIENHPCTCTLDFSPTTFPSTCQYKFSFLITTTFKSFLCALVFQRKRFFPLNSDSLITAFSLLFYSQAC